MIWRTKTIIQEGLNSQNVEKKIISFFNNFLISRL